MNTVSSRLHNIGKAFVTPLLVSQRFHKNGNNYLRVGDCVSHLINIQRSRWNDAYEAQFTVNCGVYVPRFFSTAFDRPEHRSPTLADCCITVRIGMLTESRRDKWWKLLAGQRESEADAVTGLEIQSYLQCFALPFFESFRAKRDLVEFLTHPRSDRLRFVEPRNEAQCLGYAGILCWMMGDRQQAALLLDRAREIEVKSGFSPQASPHFVTRG